MLGMSSPIAQDIQKRGAKYDAGYYGETKSRMCSVYVVLYSVLDKYLYGIVRTSLKFDCEFRYILVWLQIQIPSLEF